MSVEERLARLEAVQAINELKVRYARLADAKYTASHQRVSPGEWKRIGTMQAACFTEDAEWDGGDSFGGALRGRVALADWFTRSPWRFAIHYYVAPQIAVLSVDHAEASWKLWQIAVPEGGTDPVLLAGTTQEAYRKTPDGWLIERMRFEEIHTVELGRVDLRSLVPGGRG